jgi:hypothetical protein
MRHLAIAFAGLILAAPGFAAFTDQSGTLTGAELRQLEQSADKIYQHSGRRFQASFAFPGLNFGADDTVHFLPRMSEGTYVLCMAVDPRFTTPDGQAVMVPAVTLKEVAVVAPDAPPAPFPPHGA